MHLYTLKSISSLQEEVDYLREDNHAKIHIIKQLTDIKVIPSNSNITTGTCSFKVTSSHTYRVDNNYKQLSIHSETNTKSNKNLDKTKNQRNKNITEKLDADYINKKHKKQGYRQENNNNRKKEKGRRKYKT